MQLYRPTPPEMAAAIRLLLARFPSDAPRVGRGIDLIPRLDYETVADRNGYWQQLGLTFRVNADPGWQIDASPDERRNSRASSEATPRSYQVLTDSAQSCQCWDYMITGQPCRHVYAVMAYKAIINANLDARAQRGALDLRPAGRYEGLFDVCDCWGMTICGAVYLPKLDRWKCETDADVAAFAAWLATDEADAVIERPRAREESYV
jgi:hypothetical protein